MRRRLRHCRLRHKIHAIKTRPNNPLRFLKHKNSIRHYLANDLTCAARKTTFGTQKRFHNKQYTPKSKDQPFESDRTHFDTVFNNGNVAMHRPTFIFLLSHKITNVQQKTTNRNNQSIIRSKHKNKHETLSHKSTAKSITKTTKTNNPKSLNQNHAQNKPSKQTQQPITQYTKIFEY